MALVVEDGSQVPNAESYITVADAATYLTSRGDATFAALEQTQQENALRQATDFLVAEYRYKWNGYRRGIIQNLDWPRQYVPILDVAFGYGPFPTYYDFNTVPLVVQQACAALALKSLSGPLAPDIEQRQNMVKVGPISVEYDKYSPQATFFRAIYGMLRPYLIGTGGKTAVVRT